MDERALTYLRTLVYAALLGIPVAVAAVLFQTALHDVIHFVWEVVPGLARVGRAGRVVRRPRARRWRASSSRSRSGCRATAGTRRWRASASARSSRATCGSILLAALASLGAGLVLGPEAPLIALGLGLGIVRGPARHGSAETEAQLLVLAGAFAAIAALFGGPLVAALLIFEVAAAGGQIPARATGPGAPPRVRRRGNGRARLHRDRRLAGTPHGRSCR